MTRSELVSRIHQAKSYLCVGLDTDIAKLPHHLKGKPGAVFEFNKAIIDATKDYCVSYKINTAFYESQGLKGWEALEQTVAYIPASHFKIADAKRGDIGNTSDHYARAFFQAMNFDAVTVAPYMGADSIQPFLQYQDKWVIVLGLTSNEGSNDFQRLQLAPAMGAAEGDKLYKYVLKTVSQWGNPGNLMFVIGATQASDMEEIRKVIPEHFLLVPGVGAQGGSLKNVSAFGANKDVGLLINASRAVIFASAGEDFAEEAKKVASGYQQEMAGYLDKG